MAVSVLNLQFLDSVCCNLATPTLSHKHSFRMLRPFSDTSPALVCLMNLEEVSLDQKTHGTRKLSVPNTSGGEALGTRGMGRQSVLLLLVRADHDDNAAVAASIPRISAKEHGERREGDQADSQDRPDMTGMASEHEKNMREQDDR